MRLMTRIILLIFVATFIIGYLVYRSDQDSNLDKTKFSRVIEKDGLRVLHVLANDFGATYLVGNNDKFFYFQTNSPENLVCLDSGFQQARLMKLNLPKIESLETDFTYYVDSLIYLFAGNVPGVINLGKVDSSKNDCNLSKFSRAYSRALPINEKIFVVRGFIDRPGINDQFFYRFDTRTNETILENGISELKGDAGISTDGLLIYNKPLKSIIFTYFYESTFLIIDSYFKSWRKYTTIDSIKVRPMKVAAFSNKSTTKYTNAVPAKLVNRSTCTYGKWLLINSVNKADNENLIEYRNNAVIDMYDISTGTYNSSFYVPNYKGQKAIMFRVVDRDLMALYKSYFVLYRLSSNLLSTLDVVTNDYAIHN